MDKEVKDLIHALLLMTGISIIIGLYGANKNYNSTLDLITSILIFIVLFGVSFGAQIVILFNRLAHPGIELPP